MKIELGDRVTMKKKHPCGQSIFCVTRVGADLRLRCEGCGHEVMISREKAERMIRLIQPKENTGFTG